MARRTWQWQREYMHHMRMPMDDDVIRLSGYGPDREHFALDSDEAVDLSGLGWEELGRRLAENDFLESAVLSMTSDFLVESDVLMLFRGLRDGAAMKTFVLLGGWYLGLGGIASMRPFLHHSRNLTDLTITGSEKIEASCFSVVVDALKGGPIESLSFSGCDLEDLSPLERGFSSRGRVPSMCKLPLLRTLDLQWNNIRHISSLAHYTQLEELRLEGNDIGRAGCSVLSKLLKSEVSSLRVLGLNSTGMGDEEAEMLADSLGRNTVLTDLSLQDNPIGERGFRAFLKLLNDISSIDSTYGSNRSLRSLGLPISAERVCREMRAHINFSCWINHNHGTNPEAAGSAKVIETQLNSRRRADLCRVQGADGRHARIFSEIDPVVLPEVLAISGRKFGLSDVHCALVATPELMARASTGAAAITSGEAVQRGRRFSTGQLFFRRKIFRWRGRFKRRWGSAKM